MSLPAKRHGRRCAPPPRQPASAQITARLHPGNWSTRRRRTPRCARTPSACHRTPGHPPGPTRPSVGPSGPRRLHRRPEPSGTPCRATARRDRPRNLRSRTSHGPCRTAHLPASARPPHAPPSSLAAPVGPSPSAASVHRRPPSPAGPSSSARSPDATAPSPPACHPAPPALAGRRLPPRTSASPSTRLGPRQ